MSRYTEELLGLSADPSGYVRGTGLSFVDKRLAELSLGPVGQLGSEYIVEDSQ